MSRLSDYLRAIKECSDSELHTEFGVYDNWDILLKADYEKVLRDLEASGSFEAQRRHEMQTSLEYSHGRVSLELLNFINSMSLTMCGAILRPPFLKHIKRQAKNYNLTLTLHPKTLDSKTFAEIKGPWNLRHIAMAIGEIGAYIISNKIPAAFPDVVGAKYQEPFDCSRIIYFPK